MQESGLDWASRDLTKWLFRWLAIGHWRLLKPSKVTSKDSEVNKEEDHMLIPKVRVGVGLGLILGTGLGLVPELNPGPALDANLGIMQEPRVKVTIMVTYGAYVPSPLKDPLPRRRVSFHNPNNIRDPVKEEASCLTEPSVDDLETWLEFQAGWLGHPHMVGRTGGCAWY